MRKLLGSYSIWQALISLAILCWLIFFNFLFIKGVLAGESINDQVIFMVVFVDLVSFVLLVLPLISNKLEKIPEAKLKEFLDLPEKNAKFTFSTISSFLSDQALASFLATVLIFTGKQALETYGGEIAAVYTLFLFLVSIVLATISLVRFIMHFTKYSWFGYGVAAASSTGIMFAFFNVGLKMAA